MNYTNKPKVALLLVDIQQGFDDLDHWGGERNNPDAEWNAARLLKAWREEQQPVFHIQHNSLDPESPIHSSNEGNKIKEIVAPVEGEPVIGKSVNSGFIGTDLKEQLDELDVIAVVVCGLTTDQCVSTTTRMAGNFGYDTFLVEDACATFAKVGIQGQRYDAEMVHQVNLASINNEFAKVMDTEEVLAGL